MSKSPSPEAIRDSVRARYSSAAKSVLTGQQSSCCGASEATGCCGPDNGSTIGMQIYNGSERSELPDAAVLASLGCGNPTALAQLEAGQVVLDLGSGGGIDVLLSARRVGPEGFVYGLDMTDEMLELAEENRRSAGIENVRFLKGEIEAIPLPDESVDVILSNCVINLSADKPTVFREAYRVLKPGGLFAVSDMVIQGELDPQVRFDIESWAGCVAGALEESEYLAAVAEAGLEDVSIEVTSALDDGASAGSCCTAASQVPSDVRIVSGFVRARKPAAV